MTIYADVLVIVNLYVDFLLLCGVKRLLRLREKAWRLAIGALCGGLCSLTALLPLTERTGASLLLGAVSALATVAAAFVPLAPRMLLRAALCLWACSLLLAGTFLFLLRLFPAARGVAVLGSALYFDLSPPLLFCFTLGAYAVLWLFDRLLARGAGGLHCRWLLVEHQGRRLRLYAREDSGNSLHEPFSGLPVIVCELESLRGLAPAALLGYWEQGPPEDKSASGLRLIPFTSVGGGGLLPAFRPEKVCFAGDDRPLECYLAACPKPLSAGQYQAIYPPGLAPEQGGTDHEAALLDPAAAPGPAAGRGKPPVLHQRAGDPAPAPHPGGGGPGTG